MSNKIFISPLSSKDEQQIIFNRLQLLNPKTNEKCDYFVYNKKIYELNSRANPFHSWLVNDSVFHDGNFYILTPVDPLFLIIPIIKQKKQQQSSSNNYRSLIDIMTEQNYDSNTINSMIEICSENLLKCVADVKAFETELFIRFDRQKTLKWSCAKFKQIRRSLAKNGYICNQNNNGYSINNYSVNSEDHSSSSSSIDYSRYNMMAIEILFDYINIDDQFQNELCSFLGKSNIVDENKNDHQINDDEHRIKRKSNDTLKKFNDNNEEEKPNIESTTTQINGDNKFKKPKLTHTQRMLNKVNKTGIKDISSYFVRK